MSRIPRTPDEIFEEFSMDYKSKFGDDLLSIILYGSGAKGDYIYKKSDLNFLITLTNEGMKNIRKCLPLIKKYSKRNVTTPLFLTEEYMKNSLDSYPVEFFNIKSSYQLVYGEDVLAKLNIEKEFLRLQSERELKGKLLHLREAYLSTAHEKKLMRQLISDSITSFTSIFTVLLHFNNEAIASQKRDIFRNTAQVFKLDEKLFDQLLEVRKNTLKLSKEEYHDILEKYIAEISKLTSIVDKL